MSSASGTPQGPGAGDPGRRERAAAQRAAARRAEARNRLMLGGGAIIAVVAVVVALVLVKVTSGKSPTPAPTASGPTGAALATLVTQVTTVPAAALDAVGAGKATAKPAGVSGTPLTSGGKPEVLYIGAEYCPYCAAERWAMIVALSRFGTFSGLATTRSGITNGAGQQEPYPDTSTWTFARTTYTSRYLTFTPVEIYTNIPDPSTGGYTRLQTPTKAQQALLAKYDAPPYVPSGDQGSIPFLDMGNAYVTIGASYDPGVLQGLGWAKIAAGLHDPSSRVAQAVLGAANYMTAALCKLTGNNPASACTATVRSLQSRL